MQRFVVQAHRRIPAVTRRRFSSSYYARVTSFPRDLLFTIGTSSVIFLGFAHLQNQRTSLSFQQNVTQFHDRVPSWSQLKDWIGSMDLFRSTSSSSGRVISPEIEIKIRHRLNSIKSLPVPSLVKDYLELATVKYYRSSESRKVIFGIIAVNLAVFAAWKLVPSRFMMRYFVDGTWSGRSVTMLTSPFSHMDTLHLAFNMYGLWNIGVEAVSLMGVHQFLAFYTVAGLAGNLGSRYLRRWGGSSSSGSLGASGALLAMIAWLAGSKPDMRVELVFLPGYSFTLMDGVIGMIVFDVAGILFRRSSLDHFGHLCGTFFGLAYSQAGFGDKAWATAQETAYRVSQKVSGNKLD